ncbi:tetratricopeptide repeat protein [Corallincola platygyrae]|uniref:Tetratricopeptide repeat protein n=1 Tax=Corallincola platygyrae TaxID=1193278 RepID=A0ABW4XHZ0_9GAMM
MRLSGFGHTYPLFVDAKGMPGYYQPSDQVIKRYFNDPKQAPNVSIDTIYFQKQKPDDTLRIVVQGGSSAAGFPYGRWGGLAGMLNDRLEATFPDKNIEVITTAMSAVNSYTLLDLVDEIIEVQPDAVLIYAGHNEFIGVMGAGSALTSAQSHGAKLLFLKLKELRLYQLMQRVVSWFSPAPPAAKGGAERGTLMAKAAANREIPFGSELYEQGKTQFEGNMRLILSKYQQAGIPVVMGTLASNEKDQKPFVSAQPQGDEWQTKWEAYRTALEAGEDKLAIQGLTEMAEQFDTANAWFTLGNALILKGEQDKAREAYLKAKDRDQLRFRAPEAFNDIIRNLATEFNTPVADVQNYMRQYSKDGVIGDRLMLEHLHPNKRGYFLLTESYFNTLRTIGLMADWSRAQPSAIAWREVSITEVDEILAKYKIDTLKADFPFTDTPYKVPFPTPTDTVTQLALARQSGKQNWIANMQSLLGHYRQQQNHGQALIVARMLAQAFPTQHGPQFATGMLFLGVKEYPRAVKYLNKALELEPKNTEARKGLVYALVALKKIAPAEQQLTMLKQQLGNDPSIQGLERAVRAAQKP